MFPDEKTNRFVSSQGDDSWRLVEGLLELAADGSLKDEEEEAVVMVRMR